MISATYFGEITELDSRAVWYSDEEEDDADDGGDDELGITVTSKPKLLEPPSHETFRKNIQLNYERLVQETDNPFTTCIISLSSSPQFKNFRFNDASLVHLGNFGSFGKAFACISSCSKELSEQVLWLLFDCTHPYIIGHEVGYFVEVLREKLVNNFKLLHSGQILIISQQFSCGEHLEYLSNHPSLKPTFVGRPILPPSLIKNQFESSLFEQLTLSLKPALVICLPNPKNFWFDKTTNWPSVPNQVVEHRLNDDNLEKTLIFT